MIQAKLSHSFSRVLWGNPIWAFTGGFLGVLLAAGGLYWSDRQDRIGTVVDMRGTLVSQDRYSVVVHVSGEKLRPCQYLGIQGFMRAADGLLYEADARRLDTQETGSSKPTGFFLT